MARNIWQRRFKRKKNPVRLLFPIEIARYTKKKRNVEGVPPGESPGVKFIPGDDRVSIRFWFDLTLTGFPFSMTNASALFFQCFSCVAYKYAHGVFLTWPSAGKLSSSSSIFFGWEKKSLWGKKGERKKKILAERKWWWLARSFKFKLRDEAKRMKKGPGHCAHTDTPGPGDVSCIIHEARKKKTKQHIHRRVREKM